MRLDVTVRSAEEIEGRIRFLLSEELDRRVAEAMKRLPERCVHNHRQPLDSRKQVEGEANEDYNRVTKRGLPVVQTLGLCMYGAEDPEFWPGNICEDPVDAHRCGDWFTPKQSKAELLAEFEQEVKDPGWLETNLPEVYGLVWALNTHGTVEPLPWWKRLWFRLLRIRTEPVQNVSPALLPGNGDESVGT